MSDKHSLPLAHDRVAEAGISDVFCKISEQFRRSIRNNTRLHLTPTQVQALLNHGVYSVLAALEAEELNRLCGQDNQPPERKSAPGPSGFSTVRTGSGTAPIETIGPFAGSMAEQRAARALASEAAAQMSPRKRRKML